MSDDWFTVHFPNCRIFGCEFEMRVKLTWEPDGGTEEHFRHTVWDLLGGAAEKRAYDSGVSTGRLEDALDRARRGLRG